MMTLTLVFSSVLVGGLPSDDARAAGIQGLIHDQGRWVAPDQVIARDRQDPRLRSLLAEYAVRRSRTAGSVEGQRTLAFWCDQVGLEAEAFAHFTAVTRLAPDDPEARRRLGYRRHRDRWMTPAEVASESTEATAQALADREWGPKIVRWRRWLSETDPVHQSEAARELSSIRDPRAVPAIRRSFGDRGTWEQAWAIKILGQVDSPRSSEILAELSVFGIDESVRLAALRPLLRRDPRSVVGLLIQWLRDPIRYQVVGTTGSNSESTLRVENESSIVERTYHARPSVNSISTPTGLRGNPALEESRRVLRDRQRQDTRTIDRSNVVIELTNVRAERSLATVTGLDLGQDRSTWVGWWTSELGYSQESPKPPSKPVVTEDVEVPYTPRPPATFNPSTLGSSRHSCFAAGTLVVSRSGARPIESLRVGDQVLSQDPRTGALLFRPILAVFHNRPAATLKVDLDGRSVVATPIHRFWQAGRGWTMARDLRPGDSVRILGGVARVQAVSRDEVQPVFNLEVEHGHSFFVGESRVLVHDNSLVEPTPEPFDAGVTLAKNSSR